MNSTPDHPQRKNRLLVIGLVALCAVAWGIHTRLQAEENLKTSTKVAVVPDVVVVKPQPSGKTETLMLPATIQAWHEAPLYARTTGYLKSWTTDIGARMKSGDVLAEIDTPEIDAQWRQAGADLKVAEANAALANSTAERWKRLLKTHSVSDQDADEKLADASAKTATVASAKANLDHLQELEDFKRVTAPFDGVVTARNIDVGALVSASNSGTELFHIADVEKLRVYVNVPQINAPSIKEGTTITLKFVEYPGREFNASYLQSADALSTSTRSLLTEFVLDNHDHTILPGSYADAALQIPSSFPSQIIPVSALLFRTDGTQIATVDADHHVVMKPVKIGKDYGKTVQIIDGINDNDDIITNPPDSVRTGQEVHVITLTRDAPRK